MTRRCNGHHVSPIRERPRGQIRAFVALTRFRQTPRHPFNQSASFADGGIRYTRGMARWCNGQHPRSVRESPRVRIRAEPYHCLHLP